MATKQEAIKQIQEIKELVSKGNAIIGRKSVLSSLKNGTVKQIFLAKNIPKELEEDAKYYAKISGIEVTKLEQDNEELGILCKKNFFIAIIGVAA